MQISKHSKFVDNFIYMDWHSQSSMLLCLYSNNFLVTGSALSLCMEYDCYFLPLLWILLKELIVSCLFACIHQELYHLLPMIYSFLSQLSLLDSTRLLICLESHKFDRLSEIENFGGLRMFNPFFGFRVLASAKQIPLLLEKQVPTMVKILQNS